MSQANLPARDPGAAGASPWPSGATNSSPPHQDWETVTFPNTIDVDQLSADAAAGTASASMPSATELLGLITDLNACNDSLLRRIAQLEEALEHSQSALQSEVERSQTMNPAPPHQSQPIAQLVAELDTTTQELQRQQLLHETLRTDYDASQDRLVQLERECALLQQRYGEQSQSLIQAESTCRDLRSRLQRQQRYTLQFKVALEKCLDMSAKNRPTAVDNAPVAMPRAQQIKPWSTDPDVGPPDPGLDALIRGLRQDLPIGSPPPQPPAAPQPPQPELAVESQLWQDLERVIDTSTAVSGVPSPAPMPTPKVEPAAAPEAQFTEPSPWGAPLPAAAEIAPTPTPPTEAPASTPAESPQQPKPAQPLGEVSHAFPGRVDPGLNTPPDPAPSPVVYPQRSPTKRKSLAAIDLPNFPRAKPRQ